MLLRKHSCLKICLGYLQILGERSAKFCYCSNQADFEENFHSKKQNLHIEEDDIDQCSNMTDLAGNFLHYEFLFFPFVRQRALRA